MSTKQEIALRDKSYLIPPDLAVQPPEGHKEGFGYGTALTAAGVKVLAWRDFGSYQGDWWAKVEFPNGERYFVHGYYGSCSGCDAFEAEFFEAKKYDPDTGEYVENPAYLHQLRDFGREYLRDCMTSEQAIEEASRNLEWDHDAEEMVNWLKEQGK